MTEQIPTAYTATTKSASAKTSARQSTSSQATACGWPYGKERRDAMHVEPAKLTFTIPHAVSLKDKRQVRRSLVLFERFMGCHPTNNSASAQCPAKFCRTLASL